MRSTFRICRFLTKGKNSRCERAGFSSAGAPTEGKTTVAMGLTNLFRRALLLFYPRVYPDQSPTAQHSAEPVSIDLAGFVKGIDNVHLDVYLSPQFQRHTKKLIVAMVNQEVGASIGGNRRSGPTLQQWEDFRNAYTKMIEAAIHRAKAKDGLPLVQLAQVAAIKFLLGQVHSDLDQSRQELRSGLTSSSSPAESGRLELNEQLSWLTRNRAKLKHKMLQQLLTPILKAEEGALSELRHSLMGARWLLPKEFLTNPLLQADNPFDEEFLVKHYVLLGQGQSQESPSPYSYTAVERLIPYLFRASTPRHDTEVTLAEAEERLAKTERELVNITKQVERARKSKSDALTKQQKEASARLAAARADHDRCRATYLKAQYGWADAPANVDLLFDDGLSTEEIAAAKKSKNAAARTAWKAQRRFQRRLLATVERHFRRTGLLRQVAAAYESAPICKNFAGVLPPGELHQFVVDRTTRKGILEKIKGKQALGRPVDTAPLTQLSRRIDGLSCRQERGLLIKFLKDVLTFRRDLAYLQIMRQAAAAIELRNDPKDVRLSQANRTLYEFFGTGEAQATAQTVLNHVILKADIRGSTTMVAEMRKQSLNPASHFSLNFFDPLNKVLEDYGASKVFIEGDAVILSMIEHEEALEHRFSVARMCGIGARLLGLVQAQNAACRKNGLPELELGIGLVYSEELPTFLFDGNHPIMISPAIGKADRLSSCSWMLRKERARQKEALTNVDIYEIPEGDPLRGEKGEVHLRYNLNGIELDKDGFAKLQSELTLQEVALTLPSDETPTSFFSGRYPDLKGALHRVVIRRGRIRLFNRQHPQFGVPTADVFYEVVVNDTVLAQVEEAIKTLELTPRPDRINRAA